MAIFTHVVVGTNNLEAAETFYNAVLGAIGVVNMTPAGGEQPVTTHLYGKQTPEFMVTQPVNGEAASFANGGTIGFIAETKSAVDTFHSAALMHGGSCEGAPGPRENAGNAYGAYVRDPDGNKLCCYYFGLPTE